MMNIGLGLGFLPGMFFDRFGPRLTSAAGLIISTGSYLLVWSTTFTFNFYSDKSWLMSIFFLFTGNEICKFLKFLLFEIYANEDMSNNFDRHHTQSPLVISTSIISNLRISRRENMVLV